MVIKFRNTAELPERVQWRDLLLQDARCNAAGQELRDLAARAGLPG